MGEMKQARMVHAFLPPAASKACRAASKFSNSAGAKNPGAIVAARVRNISPAALHRPRQKVKTPGSKVRDITQGVEGVVPIGGEYVPPHRRPGEHEQPDSNEDNECASPHSLQGVSQTRHKPPGDSNGPSAVFARKGLSSDIRRRFGR